MTFQKGFTPVFVILIITAFGLAAGGGYYFYQNQKQPSTSTNVNPNTNQESTQSVEITEWETYTNAKYGYSLMHPPDWSVTRSCGLPNSTQDFYVCVHDSSFKVLENIPSVGLGAVTLDNIIGNSLLIYGEGSSLFGQIINFEDNPNPFCQPGGPVRIIDCKETTFNGITRAERTIDGEKEIVLLKDKRVVLYMRLVNQKDTKNDFPIYNQILSTFKFNQSDNSLEQITNSISGVTWSNITPNKETIFIDNSSKSLSGNSRKGTHVTKDGSLQFDNASQLQQMGWVDDYDLAADGANSMSWGYTKSVNGKKQVLLFSADNISVKSNPENGPPIVKCPCTIEDKVFLSSPF
jgi:hypothetical protein